MWPVSGDDRDVATSTAERIPRFAVPLAKIALRG